MGLLDKAKHLSAIQAADSTLWPLLVEHLLDKGWGVTDAEHWVSRVVEFEIPEKWQAVFLPAKRVITHFLTTKEFSPKTIAGKAIPLAEPNTTGKHNRTVDSVNGRPTGNSSEYLTRRIARDCPTVLAEMQAGK